MLRSRIVARPGAEPITLAEAYQHLRLDPIDSSDVTGRPDDALIEGYIAAAREYCEAFTGLSLALKDYEVVLESFPATIELPNPPFVSVLGITISDDISDNALDPSEYTVDDYSGEFAVIKPVSAWPALAAGSVARVRYRAGHGDESEAAGPVPPMIRIGLLLMLGHTYRMREATAEGGSQTIPLGVEAHLRPHRVLLGLA